MKVFTKRCFGKIPLGLWVRRSICTTWTYRVHRGNGFYGTKLGERIQMRYAYNVSDPNADHVGEGYKRNFAAAVAAWQALSSSDKAWWNREAKRLGLQMSGYNLFLRQALKGEIQMYVDRGDPVASDWTHATLTRDNAWHDLDMSSIVPAGAKAVVLKVTIHDNIINMRIDFRKNGNVNVAIRQIAITQVANLDTSRCMVVACDDNRIIEYKATAGVWDGIYVSVTGWWI